MSFRNIVSDMHEAVRYKGHTEELSEDMLTLSHNAFIRYENDIQLLQDNSRRLISKPVKSLEFNTRLAISQFKQVGCKGFPKKSLAAYLCNGGSRKEASESNYQRLGLDVEKGWYINSEKGGVISETELGLLVAFRESYPDEELEGPYIPDKDMKSIGCILRPILNALFHEVKCNDILKQYDSSFLSDAIRRNTALISNKSDGTVLDVLSSGIVLNDDNVLKKTNVIK